MHSPEFSARLCIFSCTPGHSRLLRITEAQSMNRGSQCVLHMCPHMLELKRISFNHRRECSRCLHSPRGSNIREYPDGRSDRAVHSGALLRSLATPHNCSVENIDSCCLATGEGVPGSSCQAQLVVTESTYKKKNH